MAAGSDGQHIFLGGVGVFTRDLQPTADVVYSPKEIDKEGEPGQAYVPAVDGPYYLDVRFGSRGNPGLGLTVYKYGDPTPRRAPGAFGPLPKQAEGAPPQVARGDLAEVAFLFSSAKVLVTVNANRTGFYVAPVDPESLPRGTNPPGPAPQPAVPKPNPRPKSP